MTNNPSRIISKVLSPAVGLWLRSQVQRVEGLEFKIEGGDRQIFTGYIPRISLSANYAIYQGLHLNRIQAVAENIRVNLGQVLKGQPMRLLEPVPVTVELMLTETSLKESLQAPLLSNALTDLLRTIFHSKGLPDYPQVLANSAISWEKVSIAHNQLLLGGTMRTPITEANPVLLSAGLKLASPHELRLEPLEIDMQPELPIMNLDGFDIDFGSEVNLTELLVTPEQIVCRGQIMVMP